MILKKKRSGGEKRSGKGYTERAVSEARGNLEKHIILKSK